MTDYITRECPALCDCGWVYDPNRNRDIECDTCDGTEKIRVPLAEATDEELIAEHRHQSGVAEDAERHLRDAVRFIENIEADQGGSRMKEIPQHFEDYAISTIENALKLLVPEDWQIGNIRRIASDRWGHPSYEAELEELSSPYRTIIGEGDSVGVAIAAACRAVRAL